MNYKDYISKNKATITKFVHDASSCGGLKGLFQVNFVCIMAILIENFMIANNISTVVSLICADIIFNIIWIHDNKNVIKQLIWREE